MAKAARKPAAKAQSTVVKAAQVQAQETFEQAKNIAENNLKAARKTTEKNLATAQSIAEKAHETAQSAVQKASANAEKTFTENAQKAQDFGAELFGAYLSASQAMLQGLVKMDAAILDFARTSMSEAVEVNKTAIKAENPAAAFSAHNAFMQKRIEQAGADLKTLSDIARTHSQDAWKPVLELMENTHKKFLKAAGSKK